LASLLIRETDSCQHAREAEEKFTALIERARANTMVFEQLRKELDNLLWAIEGLYMECDAARQECADAQQRIDLLEGELKEERNLKVEAKGMSAGLTAEVGQRQAEIRGLEAEVTQQRDEVRKL
jgi:chromosome segregation ATPase